MSHVCRRLYHLLGHRHKAVAVRPETLDAKLAAPLDDCGCDVHTLALSCRCLGADVGRLACLHRLTALRVLTLRLSYNSLSDTGGDGTRGLLAGSAPAANPESFPGTQRRHRRRSKPSRHSAHAPAIAIPPHLAVVQRGGGYWGPGTRQAARGPAPGVPHPEPRLQRHWPHRGAGPRGPPLCPRLASLTLDLAFNPIRAEGDPMLEALAHSIPLKAFSLFLYDIPNGDPQLV
eukprot:TRINITY_DN5692_c0_g1_i1.p1 TRINITY_DN5692_c0_g1~~TRINITY_DN5692_c0_g1_i1.p1  ORF type:complete len:260 (+),score=19.03 TRINITY_DN5692_c0_g1_i1:87-782(+)